MNSTYLTDRLELLEDIINNPNARNGIWNSLKLFVSVSDEILKDIKDFNGKIIPQAINESVIQNLQSIRQRFQEVCGFEFGSKRFENAKNSRSRSHKLKSQVSKFLEEYRGRFVL